MSVPGTAASLRRLLEEEFRRVHPGDTTPFVVATSEQMSKSFSETVTLFPYRVEVDPTRRHVELPSLDETGNRRVALLLEMHFLVTVWPGNLTAAADKQLDVLEDCLAILDRNAVLAGDWLHPGYTWHEDAAVRVALEPMAVEDMMRVWDALKTTYQLSVSYVVRTARVAEREVSGDHADVRSRRIDFGQRGR